MRERRAIVVGAVVVSGLLVLSCRDFAFSRVEAEAHSPEGSAVAEVVVNRLSIDAARQSLVVRSTDKRMTLRHLAEDKDWCDTIVWSPDSGLVAVLIQGLEADVYAATTGKPILRVDLTPRVDYPPNRMARSVTFTSDGQALAFQICDRGLGSCGGPSLVRLDTPARNECEGSLGRLLARS